MLSSLRTHIGLNPEENELQNDDDNCNIGKYFKMSYRSRITGCIILTAIGFLFAAIGSFSVFVGRFVSFGICYTMGNVCLIIASLFLFGPMRQCKSMISSWHRALATGVYFAMICLTLYVALVKHNGWGCLVCIILQCVAYVWYIITAVPGGQTVCETVVRSTV